MITNFFIPELNNHDVQELWFQQDGATCHTARATIDLLKDTFGDRLISRFGPVNWPPRSCDLTPLDYFVWGYVKSLVYADKPQTLDHLEDNIRRVIADIRPHMLEKVIENWTSRLDYIRASRGSPMPEIIFKISYHFKNKICEQNTECSTVSSEELIPENDSNVSTASIMADKDILELVQSSKNIIDVDSDDENKMNNAAHVPTSSEMKNAMKIAAVVIEYLLRIQSCSLTDRLGPRALPVFVAEDVGVLQAERKHCYWMLKRSEKPLYIGWAGVGLIWKGFNGSAFAGLGVEGAFRVVGHMTICLTVYTKECIDLLDLVEAGSERSMMYSLERFKIEFDPEVESCRCSKCTRIGIPALKVRSGDVEVTSLFRELFAEFFFPAIGES
ncbi:uncharacterized protein TNCV_1395771 [Trichonephila clavipes]|nr:uncharacterized protein TNCV_1395771 [Trichonephila clavipes]